jgi:hypothetical protein
VARDTQLPPYLLWNQELSPPHTSIFVPPHTMSAVWWYTLVGTGPHVWTLHHRTLLPEASNHNTCSERWK